MPTTANQNSNTIAIVGAGPCGLTLARLLECKGIKNYLVFERDVSRTTRTTDAPHHAGGSLDLHPTTGQRAIKEAGLFEEFQKHARWDDGVMGFRDGFTGEKLIDDLGAERDLPEIDRGVLRDMLLDSIPEDKIRWGHALRKERGASIGEDGRPVLEFANGEKLSGFKLVVGTDGAWSKVRPLLTSENPHYQGMHYIESRIYSSSPASPVPARLFGHPGGTFLAIGNGKGAAKGFISQHQGDGHWRNYLCLEVPCNFGRELNMDDTEAMRSLFCSEEYYGSGSWSEEYKDMIRHSTDFRSWALQHHQYPSPQKVWDAVPGVTLAGDAAHTSTPFAGEGVNCAMTDAVELANKIAGAAEKSREDFNEAIRNYEVDMFHRGVNLISKSKRNGEMIWHDGGAEVAKEKLRTAFVPTGQ